jgi:hypothetical protein
MMAQELSREMEINIPSLIQMIQDQNVRPDSPPVVSGDLSEIDVDDDPLRD